MRDYAGQADWNVAATVTLDPEVYTSVNSYDALGRPLLRHTPDGARLAYAYLAGGGLAGLTLTTDDGLVTNLPVVGGATYNARGQRSHVRLGCGVEVDHRFDPDTFRTSGVRAVRPPMGGGGATVLQDLAYSYDPMGNVVSCRDAAHEPPATGVIHGLGVSAASGYTYDALYQLIAAEGRMHNALLEHDDRPHGMAPGAFRGSRRANLNDGGAISRYRRIYSYDSSGNLTRIRHTGVAPWTKDIAVAPGSNRAVPALDANGLPVPAPQTCFDPAGNCIFLPHLRRIDWNHSGLVSRVVVIDRTAAGQPDDAEYYAYHAAGLRVRKVTERLVNGVPEVTDKLYLDGCEIKRIGRGGVLRLARLTSLIDDDVGRAAVVHRWTLDTAQRETDNISVPRVHYSLVDHLGSAQVQFAGDGRVISYEEYFPFGGTAFIAGDDAREVSLKEYRYNGKERDEASGFYYFGYRYYCTTVGRWLSPDPIGPDGGLNLYAYCSNNPVTLADPDGLKPQAKGCENPVHYDTYESFVARIPPNQQVAVDRSRRAVGVQDKGYRANLGGRKRNYGSTRDSIQGRRSMSTTLSTIG